MEARVYRFPRPVQGSLDIDLPPDNGDRRPVCVACNARPADVLSEETPLCGGCALTLFGGFFYDKVLGEL